MNNYLLSTSNLFEPNISKIKAQIKKRINENGDIDATIVLESELAEYHQSRYCITFSSGFWALVAMVIIKSKKKCNEVLMPSLTYRRLADVVYWAGKIPVFVDIDKNNLAISSDAIRKNITNKTSLIIAVHPIVNCLNVKDIINISNEYQIPVVIDAVESVHETYDGKKIGSFSVGEVFSLHSCKLFNGMEGGYVCTNNKILASKLINFRNRESINTNIDVGLNLPLNDIHSIFALESLSEVEKIIQHNYELYEGYRNKLNGIADLRLLIFDENDKTSFKNIVVEVLDNFPISRCSLVELLNKKNILARAHYYPALHSIKHNYNFRITDMTNTNRAAERYLNLPCGSRVSLDDVDYICSLIENII